MDYKGQADLMRKDAAEFDGPGYIVGDLRQGAQSITDLLTRAEKAESALRNANRNIHALQMDVIKVTDRAKAAEKQLARYKNGGLEPCDYSVIKAALSNEEKAKKDLNDIIHALEGQIKRAEAAEARAEQYKAFFDDVAKKPNCNTCANQECTYRPKPGEITRFNCPLWNGPEEE